MRRVCFGALSVCLVVGSLLAFQAPEVRGASSFADSLFRQQWDQGEALTPNFWGPLSTAKDGQMEPYADVPGGMRLVQYFDKGRMELRNGVVTNGLLASEIVRGKLQVGDAAFLGKDPPAIPIAGDADNPGPTYAQLSTTAAMLLANTPAQPNGTSAATVGSDGTVTPGASTLAGPVVLTEYDTPTQHNVPGVFVDYRTKAGLGTIGYAISEPFGATVKVAGQQKGVLIQVFERRVLTFTPTNDPVFQVEMGNIGQHYYQWRYSGAPAGGQMTGSTGMQAPPTVAAVTATSTTVSASITGPTTAPVVLTGPLPPPPATLPVGTLPPGLRTVITPPPMSAFPKPPPYTGPIYKCSDFPSQAAAQAYLRLYPSDPSRLDPSATGIACPNNPAPFDRTPVTRH